MEPDRPRSFRRTVPNLARALILLPSLLLGSSTITASLDASERQQQAAVRAKDVESIDAIVSALYDSISGPAGTRDWDRLRSLFHEGARLIPCRRLPDGAGNAARVLSVEDFIRLVEPNVQKQGFFEREIQRGTERFGATAHVFSTYESRHAKGDPEPFVRGINSIQLFFDGKRWWVVTIYWDSERPDQPIPREYLPKK